MQIPRYKAEAILRHLSRIVGNASCDQRDTRTLDALRLAKGDLRWLAKTIQKDRQDDNDHGKGKDKTDRD